MQTFEKVIYSRYDKPEDEKKGKIIAGKFQLELGKVGEKVRVGVYRLMSIVDVAGLPEPDKKEPKKPSKKTDEKGKS